MSALTNADVFVIARISPMSETLSAVSAKAAVAARSRDSVCAMRVNCRWDWVLRVVGEADSEELGGEYAWSEAGAADGLLFVVKIKFTGRLG